MARVVQWLNENAHRAYPLAEDANRNCSGETLPDNVLLDFQLLDFESPEALVYLQSVTVAGTMLDFVFVYGAVTRTVTVSTAAATQVPINYGTAEPYRITVVFGAGIEDVADWGDGTYTFDDPPLIEPALLNFENEHRITSVQAVHPTDSEILTGTINMKEGYNCRIDVSDTDDSILITAQKGAGLGIPCDTETEGLLLCSEVLLRVNGLVSGQDGNFQFFGGPGVSVLADPDNHTIVFRSGLNDYDKVRCG